MTPPPKPGVDSLLEHAEFVRGLARGLLGNTQDADDLAQDAWVAALKRPPEQEGGQIRGWFRKIVRNTGANRMRDARRREQHEQAAVREGAVRDPAVPAVDEILEREQVRRRVVEAVVSLPEPRRAVVLLRYFEGLSSTEIGNRLGRSPATVRGQLRDGLEMLRTRLDREHGGNRAAWTGPLAGLLNLPTKQTLVVASLAPVVRWLWIGAAAATVCGGIWFALGGDDPQPNSHLVADAPDDPVAAEPETTPSAADRATVVVELTATTEPSRWTCPAERGPATLHGRVVDRHTREPVAGAQVVCRSHHGRLRHGYDLVDDRNVRTAIWTAADGSFLFDQLPSGPYRLEFSDDTGRRARRDVVASAQRDEPITIGLDERHALYGHVIVEVSDPNGRPVLDANVELIGADQVHGPIGYRGAPSLTGKTDADGRCDLHAPGRLDSLFEGLVTVTAADGRVALERIARPEHGNSMPVLRVTLEPPGTIEGTLRADAVDAFDGLAVFAHPGLVYGNVYRSAEHLAKRATIEGDRFRIEGVPPGSYRIEVRGERGQRAVFEKRPPNAWVETGKTVEVDLQVAIGARVVGTVRTSDNRPLAGVRIRAHKASDSDGTVHVGLANVITHPDKLYDGFTAVTDAVGRYELVGLPPARYELRAALEGWSHGDAAVHASVEEVASVDLVLGPAGVLQGVANPGDLGIRPVNDPDSLVRTWISGDGSFTLPGIAAGEYEVGAWDYKTSSLLVSRVVEIEAHRTTWVDLRDMAVAHASGRVVADGQPVEGAAIAIGERIVATTGADGQFRARLRGTKNVRGSVAVDGLLVGKFRWRSLQLGENAVPDVDVSGPPLTLRALDEHGRPATASVRLWGGWPDYADEVVRRTNREGVVHFRIAPPEKFKLRVSFDSGVRVFERIEREAGDDPITVEVREHPHATARLHVVDTSGRPIVGLGISVAGNAKPGITDDPALVYKAREWTKYVRTDDNGVALFRGIRAGQMLFFVSGGMQDDFGYDPPGGFNSERPPGENVTRIAAGSTVDVRMTVTR